MSKKLEKAKGKAIQVEEDSTRQGKVYDIVFHDQNHKQRFDALLCREISCTRFLEWNTLEKLGFKDEIHALLAKVGWENFMNRNYPTYPRLVLEFLSTLEIQSRIEDGEITFRLFDEPYTWTFSDFNATFDLPHGGRREVPVNFKAQETWSILGGKGEFHPSISRMSSVTKPVYRYLILLMKNTIFGRGEKNKVVCRDEILSLWAMIKGQNVNTGYLFLNHLINLARPQHSSPIVLGGLITRIALMLGLDLEGLDMIEGNSRIDLNYCIEMKVIENDNTACSSKPLTKKPPVRTFDFTPLNAILETLQADHVTIRNMLEEQIKLDKDQFDYLKQLFAKDEELFMIAYGFINQQKEKWEEKEDYRFRMRRMGEQVDHMYQYQAHLRREKRWFIESPLPFLPDLPDFPLVSSFFPKRQPQYKKK